MMGPSVHLVHLRKSDDPENKTTPAATCPLSSRFLSHVEIQIQMVLQIQIHIQIQGVSFTGTPPKRSKYKKVNLG